MIILAHRGLWKEPDQRNSRAALRMAFERGYGVETDVRDSGGKLVISHDMAGPAELPLSTVLADYDAAGTPGCLALNIKADGLASALLDELDAFEGMRSKTFVFDMSVPDTLPYLGKLPVFTRWSELEPLPPLETRAQGIWMDCFVNAWVSPVEIVRRLELGQRLAVVSPELHKRDCYHSFWKLLDRHLSRVDMPKEVIGNNLMVCTDFPEDAELHFSRNQK